jgi:hypothetical protein
MSNLSGYPTYQELTNIRSDSSESVEVESLLLIEGME